jgi:hypothetical protein
MIGAAEVLVVALILLIIIFSRQKRASTPKYPTDPDGWTIQARIRIPRRFMTLVGTVGAAVATAGLAFWLDLPSVVGTIATGAVAGTTGVLLAGRDARRRR